MQAVVHRWHERGRQGCSQPEHWLRRLQHHLRRWVIARVLPYWPERQHDWYLGLCARPRRQDLPGAHLWWLDRQGPCYGLLHQVQTPRSHKLRCPSGCHSIWDERPSGGLSPSRCASRTTCPPSAVSTGTVVRSSAEERIGTTDGSRRIRRKVSHYPAHMDRVSGSEQSAFRSRCGGCAYRRPARGAAPRTCLPLPSECGALPARRPAHREALRR